VSLLSLASQLIRMDLEHIYAEGEKGKLSIESADALSKYTIALCTMEESRPAKKPKLEVVRDDA
jgi:hypothetical protein